MKAFKTITLKNGVTWACNADGKGLFTLRPDGTYCQHVGTCDTPVFRNGLELSRYVKKRFSLPGERQPRMISRDF